MNAISKVLSYAPETRSYSLSALLEAAAAVHADPLGRRPPVGGVPAMAQLLNVAVFHPRSASFGMVVSVGCTGRMSDPSMRVGADAVSPVLLCGEWVVIDANGAVSSVADYIDGLADADTAPQPEAAPVAAGRAARRVRRKAR